MTWRLRLNYALLAGLVGWLTGWLVSWPMEFATAWRYVDGHAGLLPEALSKGLVVWAAFCFFMSVVGFVPLALPVFLLVSPAWIVRWRWWLIPLAPVAATLAMYRRMALLTVENMRHPGPLRAFFFAAPNFFALGFGLGVMVTYVVLAKRRIEEIKDGASPRHIQPR